MRMIFAPFSILTGLIAGLIAKKAFDATWQRIDGQEPPNPEHREIHWPRLIAALAIQGAVFTLTRGLIDHATRVWFSRWVGGRWPGEERPSS